MNTRYILGVNGWYTIARYLTRRKRRTGHICVLSSLWSAHEHCAAHSTESALPVIGRYSGGKRKQKSGGTILPLHFFRALRFGGASSRQALLSMFAEGMSRSSSLAVASVQFFAYNGCATVTILARLTPYQRGLISIVCPAGHRLSSTRIMRR